MVQHRQIEVNFKPVLLPPWGEPVCRECIATSIGGHHYVAK
jgi:hypothetical protein